jgi:ABC-type proline/glycine betaine transport systems, periplasmic components
MKSVLALLACVLALFLTSLSPAHAQKTKTVTISYVEWPCAVASSNLAKAVIEEKLGYKVELVSVTAAIMWQSVALGETDACVTAWLPVTHAAYLEKTRDKIEVLSTLARGARLGWVVPDYVTISSIADLPGNEAKFDSKIYGIDPGAGLMQLSEKALKDYNLTGYTLIDGSDAVMVGALADAIRNKKWIVVTGWSPHWMFGRWQLKYLEDPKKSLGEEEVIHTIARKGLKDDMPEVHAFLRKFSYTDTSQLEKLMASNEAGGDPLENAKKFMQNNKEQVESWLK